MIKKCAGIILILIFILTLPLGVLAAVENHPVLSVPVSHARINTVAGSGDNYVIAMQWNRPTPLNNDPESVSSFSTWAVPDNPQAGLNILAGLRHTDGTLPSSGAQWTRFPEWYDLYSINRSLRGVGAGTTPFPNHIGRAGHVDAGMTQIVTPPLSQAAGVQSVMATLPAQAMMHSSLYEFRVIPGHFNARVSAPIPPSLIGTQTRVIAPPDTGANVPNEQTVVFLTDIEIRDVQASGNSLIVEWYNPSWNNVNESIFDEWAIAWQPASAADPIPLTIGDGQNQGHRFISTDSVNFTIVPADNPARTVIRAEIFGVNLVPTAAIRVRVEPRIMDEFGAMQFVRNNVPNALQNNMHIIDGRTVQVAHRGLRDANQFVSGPVMVAPSLSYIPFGQNDVLLSWSSLTAIAGSINQVIVQEQIGATWTNLLSLAGTVDVGQISEHIVPGRMPLATRYFRLRILMNDGAFVYSNIVVFDPLMATFHAYRPTIQQATPTDDGRINPLRFLGFLRQPHTLIEQGAANLMPFDGQYLDTEITYRLFVTDNITLLNQLISQHEYLAQFHALSVPRPVFAEPVFQFTHPDMDGEGITHFQAMGTGGAWERVPIAGNRTYHIALEALRMDSQGNLVRSPYIAFYTVFVPPVGPVEVRPVMMPAPPLRVIEPVQPTYINIAWDLRYLEIAETVTDENGVVSVRWHGAAGLPQGSTDASEMVFGRSAVTTEGIRGLALNEMLASTNPLLLSRMRAQDFNTQSVVQISEFLPLARTAVAEWLGINDINLLPPIRIQDLSARSFSIHTATLAAVLNFVPGGLPLAEAYEAYRIARLCELTASANANNWRSINHEVSGGVATYQIDVVEFPGGTIQPNTGHIIYLRPYQEFPSVPPLRLVAFYPTYVIVTTPNEPELLVPDPTTPILEPVSEFTSMSTVGVRWQINGGLGEDGLPAVMTYSVRWAEQLVLFPGGGNLITWDMIMAAILAPNDENPSEIRVHNGEYYIYLQIPTLGQPHLFADTNHYIWANATSIYNVTSSWSNPVEVRTHDIPRPLPPIGLGRAPASMINLFNSVNNTEHAANAPDALNITWRRIFADIATNNPRADAGEAVGGTVIPLNLPVAQFNNTHIARFEGLLPNRAYYVRGRTIFTVQRGGPPNGVFSYEIWLANNEDFLDAIVFMIPPVVPPLGVTGADFRRAYSEWVIIPPITTAPSDDDFDGIFDPEQFPLPEYDWEITYDNGTLMWRFRTNRIGADGRPDQQADQRFVSRLVDSRVHRYEIDLSAYVNQPGWPVRNRELVIPLSIVRAFNERLITLDINFGDMVVSIPPGAFDTAAVRGLNMGIGSYVHIGMQTNEQATGLPALVMNHRFATLPQQFSVRAVTPQRTLVVPDFARPLDVALSSPDVIGPEVFVNTTLLFSSPQTGGWRDAGGLETQIQQPGTVAAVVREAPMSVLPADPSQAAMERVTSRLTFTDMFEYNPHRQVNADEFNNVMNALVNNRTGVNLNATMSNADRQALERARFLASAPLTWEAAADILVRFYELRTRQIIEPMTSPQMLPGLENATPALQHNILKASDIGFITMAYLQPRSVLMMGDLMVMLDAVIRDIGF